MGLTLQTQESMVSSTTLLLLLSTVLCQGLAGSSSSNRGVGSVRNPSLKQNEDVHVAGSHQSSFYTYEDYGSTGVDGADYVDYEYEGEGEEDRQDLGLVGSSGLVASVWQRWEPCLPQQCSEL